MEEGDESRKWTLFAPTDVGPHRNWRNLLVAAQPSAYADRTDPLPCHEAVMSVPSGSSLADLDSPQLLLDLDQLDANLGRLQTACRERQVDLRVHFKSLK